MKLLITGGAGFIGSHLADFLLTKGFQVSVIDNLSWGKRDYISHNLNNPNYNFIKTDLLDYKNLYKNVDSDIDTVFHLSANSDIMRGETDMDVDVNNTIISTLNLLKVMKQKKIKKIFYTSGSGVYGDVGQKYVRENFGPLFPISLYGSTKLSAESLISCFVHLYDMKAWIVRPANIIGDRATHGVILDFINKLKKNSSNLQILGSGLQCKSYLYISDVLEAFYLIWKNEKAKINLFNISSKTFIKVNDIAKIVIEEMGLQKVKIERTGGKGGWKGDVPVIKLDNTKLEKLGFKSKYSSDQAVRKTVRVLLGKR